MSTTLVTHRQPDGTEWIHSHSDDRSMWLWVCINPDGTHNEYLCNQHGWIDASTPPKRDTDYLTCLRSVTGTVERRVCEYWNGRWDGMCGAEVWMPLPELPQPATPDKLREAGL